MNNKQKLIDQYSALSISIAKLTKRIWSLDPESEHYSNLKVQKGILLSQRKMVAKAIHISSKRNKYG